jgi:plasmid stability protein
MLKNTTFNLPEELVARAKAYAAAHGTTMTALIREHLDAVTSDGKADRADDPLAAYSRGRLARNDAIRLLGLRDIAGGPGGCRSAAAATA